MHRSIQKIWLQYLRVANQMNQPSRYADDFDPRMVTCHRLKYVLFADVPEWHLTGHVAATITLLTALVAGTSVRVLQ